MHGAVERPGVSGLTGGGIRSSGRSSLCLRVAFELIGIYIAQGSLSVHTGDGKGVRQYGSNVQADFDDGGP
jgi:hypothetical protein